MSAAGRLAGSAASSGLVTYAARRLLAQHTPGGADRWTRTNHQGAPISLLEGPAVALGAAAGLAGGALGGSCGDFRTAAAGQVAVLGAGTFGLIDDLTEDTSVRTKGLKGHLGALREGRVTTGALKIAGIGGSAMLAAAIGTPRSRNCAFSHHAAHVVVNGMLIAATANLLNLLDLRPGRALKSAAFLAAIPAGGPLAASATGAVVGVDAAAWTGDLTSRDMLGDGGANALGALVGTRLAFGLSTPAKLAALGAVIGLTLASEKVSFTKVIAETPWLRAIDEFGRA